MAHQGETSGWRRWSPIVCIGIAIASQILLPGCSSSSPMRGRFFEPGEYPSPYECTPWDETKISLRRRIDWDRDTTVAVSFQDSLGDWKRRRFHSRMDFDTFSMPNKKYVIDYRDFKSADDRHLTILAVFGTLGLVAGAGADLAHLDDSKEDLVARPLVYSGAFFATGLLINLLPDLSSDAVEVRHEPSRWMEPPKGGEIPAGDRQPKPAKAPRGIDRATEDHSTR